MGKKNKFLINQQKKVRKSTSKKDPEVGETSKVADVECPNESKDQALMVATAESNKHLEQVAAIAIMPLHLDQQIEGIKAIQHQLYKLHLQQGMMLDGCTKLLQELNDLQPRNDTEEKLILDTFHDIKDKLSDVWALPARSGGYLKA